jgi:hypothetical protein
MISQITPDGTRQTADIGRGLCKDLRAPTRHHHVCAGEAAGVAISAAVLQVNSDGNGPRPVIVIEIPVSTPAGPANRHGKGGSPRGATS